MNILHNSPFAAGLCVDCQHLVFSLTCIILLMKRHAAMPFLGGWREPIYCRRPNAYLGSRLDVTLTRHMSTRMQTFPFVVCNRALRVAVDFTRGCMGRVSITQSSLSVSYIAVRDAAVCLGGTLVNVTLNRLLTAGVSACYLLPIYIQSCTVV